MTFQVFHDLYEPCVHMFHCNSAGLSNVRYNRVFVIAGFVIAECHCGYFLHSNENQSKLVLLCNCQLLHDLQDHMFCKVLTWRINSWSKQITCISLLMTQNTLNYDI